MTSSWVEFFIMAGTFLLVAVGALIWLLYVRKPRRRRHKHRHHHRHRSSSVTLAQGGGLPPLRRDEPPSDPPSPTAQS